MDARSLRDPNAAAQSRIGFLSELHALHIHLFLHQQGLDTTTPAGNAMFHMSRLLLNDVDFDFRDTPSDHIKHFGGGTGNIDYSSRNEWPSVVDSDCYRSAIGDVCYPQARAEWQRRVGRGQFARVELFTARSL
jgi:hypothetical protein